MKFAYTILFVQDLPKVRAFYETYFNQQVDVDFDYLIGFSSGLALWRQEEGAESLEHAHQNPLVNNRGGMELEFHTQDIVGDFQRLSAAGVQFIHPIKAHPWQQFCFRCLDPEGHVIEVAEALAVTARRLFSEGWPEEAIAHSFKVKVDVVRDMLK